MASINIGSVCWHWKREFHSASDGCSCRSSLMMGTHGQNAIVSSMACELLLILLHIALYY